MVRLYDHKVVLQCVQSKSDDVGLSCKGFSRCLTKDVSKDYDGIDLVCLLENVPDFFFGEEALNGLFMTKLCVVWRYLFPIFWSTTRNHKSILRFLTKTDEKNSWFGFDRGTRSWLLSSFVTMYPQERRSEHTQGTQAPPHQPHENHVQPSSAPLQHQVTRPILSPQRLRSYCGRTECRKMRLHQGHSEPNKGPTNLKPLRSKEEKGTEEEKSELVPVDSDRRKVRQKRLFDAQNNFSIEWTNFVVDRQSSFQSTQIDVVTAMAVEKKLYMFKHISSLTTDVTRATGFTTYYSAWVLG
ncbi:hypothetical protein PROFUN_00214 [Planoprotostelium fungivorum]|uniref:Uncharacterized protein n=1 Tax=Planoprotostelium fungivorum TaxID=1890364 RepID=A0A2P6NXS7_9EUKA|nr:hypothetical protein PROFUN_00214 [Planoprotostelium fungivorum]